MVLTLLRHAPLPAEYHRRYIGHSDIPIDPDLFDPVKTAPLSHHRYDRVYSSDLVRCTLTLEHMGIDSFTTDPRLREVRFKPAVEGKNFSQIEQMEGFDPRFLDSRESWHRFVCEEPMEAFRSRIESFLQELHEGEEILICTHAGTIGMICSILAAEDPGFSPEYLDHIIIPCSKR